MNKNPLRVASLGMGWWSDVLADAIQRSSEIEIVSCFTRSQEKRKTFAKKYGCTAADSYEDILKDPSIDAIINTTPNHVHLETTRAAAVAGKATFLDKPIANTIADGKEIASVCREAGVVLSIGYQRRRENQFQWIRKQIDEGKFGKLVQAEANISRDREGKFDLSSWRYTAEGMPGGVMLQIGIHYVDVLEFLMGPVAAVSARTAQLVLPGDNPDVANLLMEHENGAQSILSASYASASEYYLLNIYGKEATAYFDLFEGLRHLTRGSARPEKIPFEKNDTIREELEEFANCVRGDGEPEISGERATESLAVIRAGLKSAREGRRVEVSEILESPDE
jgi:predicted dehydrogenase